MSLRQPRLLMLPTAVSLNAGDALLEYMQQKYPSLEHPGLEFDVDQARTLCQIQGL